LLIATINFSMSVCLAALPPAWNNSAPTGLIIMKFDIWVFFENISNNIKFDQSLTSITGTLHKGRYIFWSYLAQFVEWETFQTKVVQKIKTHFLFNNFFWKSCYLRDNVQKYCRAVRTTDDNMRHALCMLDTLGYTKKTHSEYVILIAFPRQQWSHKRASLLGDTYFGCRFKSDLLVYRIILHYFFLVFCS